MNSGNFITVFIWGLVAIIIYELLQQFSNPSNQYGATYPSASGATMAAAGTAPGSPGLTNELQYIVNNLPSSPSIPVNDGNLGSTALLGTLGTGTTPAGFTYNSNDFNTATQNGTTNPYDASSGWAF